ncbi:hypothetical protein AX14_007619 [Amanita brunnescens Koide BX004]|nr:hypothetical protein AX14_007619 [Amanita brunnescens Koide BX004]
MLECRVYAKHSIREDNFIGGSKDRMKLLFAEGTGGAITRELCKFDSRGNQRKTQVIIEFTIATTSKASDATEVNMEEAVVQGNDALLQMKMAPSSFEPIQGAIDTSVATATVIKSLSDTWDPLLQKVELFTKLVDGIAEVHPYANMAWSILSAVPKTILAQVDRDNGVVRLASIMDDAFFFVKEAEPIKKIESQGRIIALIAQQTTECGYFIRDYATNKNFWERALKNSFLSDIDSKIKKYEDKFKELKMAFQDHAVLRTGITVSRIFDNLDSLATDLDLHDIPYANGTRFDPDKGCLPGTRNTIINEIIQWVNRPNGDDVPRIFLLTGVAGSGKSAIAHAIAKLFDPQQRLGSSYCFLRADQANRRPDNLLSTIALDIADLDQHWKTSLGNIVKGNRSLRTTLSVTEQFKNFILEPAKALETVGPILVVIDALDESAEDPSRKALLRTLAKGISDLPSNLRILITARPERDILSAFKDNLHVICKYMNTIDEASNKADIALFVETQLSDVHSLELEWPNKRWCQMLVESSDGLFQWVSTACQAIKDNKGALRQTERLSRFVSSARGLDALYSEVLRQAFDQQDDDSMSRFKLVMGRILAVKEPLSISAHSELRSDDEPADLVELILPLLGSLLSGVDQHYIPIRPLHASFFDFLTDQNRSGTYYVDPSQQNRSLTLSSLRVMKSGLRFNIAGLETSHCRNADVQDLATRIEQTISPHLSYGCCFWADHLHASTYNTDILNEVRDFFYHRFLYWLEVLSLIKRVNVASGMLLSVMDWTRNQDNSDDVALFANDADKFISVFGHPVSQSTPHIYLSALPFAPKNSLVAKHYLPLFQKTLHLKTGKADHWPAIIAVFEGHTDCVTSIAFSLDGKRIVSGSEDSTIRVWDARIGEVVVGPLKGHTNIVTSVGLSPDGNRIVSGSVDQTILVWDAETGEVVIGPLEAHTNDVNSVAFSPDGNCIVSGSDDNTIRVWDAETGEVVIGPLKGHTNSVHSVAFSPDSNCIVSGSGDNTIRVWDAKTGEFVVGPLEGHDDMVYSVAFSSDGNRIVSGSKDNTIRVWNAKTGEVIVGPLEGHTHWVISVAFAPDGNRIVSSSVDNMIRIWDAETGKVVRSFKGHAGAVYSVRFSPDGNRIISGSEDKTIRVWDAKTGEVVEGLLEGHTSCVNSVTFSPDGKRFASGSQDGTIRVWDAKTGKAVVGPFEGQVDAVYSVAFSPDGNRIVSSSESPDGSTIGVWDAASGEVVIGPLKGHAGSVYSAAFSQDGNLIVSGSGDKTIRVWDAKTGEVVAGPLEGHSGSIYSAAFSQDGNRIISGSEDKTIRVWDAKTREVVVGPLEGHTGLVSSVAFSQDGNSIVSGSSDNTIRVWDAKPGEVVLEPLEGHTDIVNSVAFSPDGKHIVSGSFDNTVRVWDAKTGDVVAGPLEGHTQPVSSVAFSRDGNCIASCSADCTIRVFSMLNNDLVNDFTDTSTLTDGWICNSPSKPLFWVPAWNRPGLCWPRNPFVICLESCTRLDLDNFVHGDSWQHCKDQYL